MIIDIPSERTYTAADAAPIRAAILDCLARQEEIIVNFAQSEVILLAYLYGAFTEAFVRYDRDYLNRYLHLSQTRRWQVDLLRRIRAAVVAGKTRDDAYVGIISR